MVADNKKDNRVYIELPIAEENARLLRLLTAGVAGRLQFSLVEIDDLKIAVEEALLMALECCAGEKLKISFNFKDDELEIVLRDLNLSSVKHDNDARKHQDYGFFIIKALVDKFQFIEKEDKCDMRLVKRRLEAVSEKEA